MICLKALHHKATARISIPRHWLGGWRTHSLGLPSLCLHNFRSKSSNPFPSTRKLPFSRQPNKRALHSTGDNPAHSSCEGSASPLHSYSETAASLLEATHQETHGLPSTEDSNTGLAAEKPTTQDPSPGPSILVPSPAKPWEKERDYFKYRMRIAYDGTNYWGWQVQLQSGYPTIQGRLEEALTIITREPRDVLRVLAAGRTDAGVHARGQVAHFFTSKPLENLESVHLKLNGKNVVESPYSSIKLRPKGVLPVDIRILELAPVTHDFHARFSAVSKFYSYSLATRPVFDPLNRLYSAHVFYEVNIERIKEAALHFVGEHDFASFANFYPRPLRDLNADTVRTITRFDVLDTEQGVRLEIEGTGFLYRQIRNMVGLLVEVGRGQYEPSIVPKILALRNRQLVPTSAPAHGLVMESITYPEDVLRPPEGASSASTGRLVQKPRHKSRLEARLAAV